MHEAVCPSILRSGAKSDEAVGEFIGSGDGFLVRRDLARGKGQPRYAPVGDDHLVFEKESVNGGDGAFGTIAPTHDHGPADLVRELAPQRPGAVDKGLELGGDVVEIDGRTQHYGVGLKQVRDEGAGHVVLEDAVPGLEAAPAGFAGLDVVLGEFDELSAGAGHHLPQQDVGVGLFARAARDVEGLQDGCDLSACATG